MSFDLTNYNTVAERIAEFRPVVGYEGHYEVSNDGDIRSLDQWVKRGSNGLHLLPGRVLRQSARKYGHRYVVLKVARVPKHCYVHRAVLDAFVGPCPDGMECRHLDGNAANNKLDNLAWGTPAENRRDIALHGTDHQLNKTHCPQGHPLGDVYVRPGSGRRERICKTCSQVRSKECKRRRREKERAA
jgi:hypothetical protein